MMAEETKITEVPTTPTPAGITEVVNDTPQPAQKKVMSLKVTFYEQDQGNQNMAHWLEVECPNPSCKKPLQLVNWRNEGSEGVRSLLCPACGRKLYTAE